MLGGAMYNPVDSSIIWQYIVSCLVQGVQKTYIFSFDKYNFPWSTKKKQMSKLLVFAHTLTFSKNNLFLWMVGKSSIANPTLQSSVENANSLLVITLVLLAHCWISILFFPGYLKPILNSKSCLFLASTLRRSTFTVCNEKFCQKPWHYFGDLQ